MKDPKIEQKNDLYVPEIEDLKKKEREVEIPDSALKPRYIPAYMTGFLLDIDRMNEMYRMPEVEDTPSGFLERLEQFKSILLEEVKEIDDITAPMYQLKDSGLPVTGPSLRIETLTSLSDLLGDIIVYCASEAKRWNIPIDRVLDIIMQSNFSKLDSNGQPIYDERMKLMKGPSYWRPEPKIAELLAGPSLEMKPVES